MYEVHSRTDAAAPERKIIPTRADKWWEVYNFDVIGAVFARLCAIT